MLGHRELNTEDYFAILRRRWALVACSTIALLASGMVLSRVLPPVYESQTLVLVQRQVVPEDYVKPVVDQDLDAQLASLKEQILSRSRLEPIISRYDLFASDKRNMDDRVDLTRKAIKITPIYSAQAHDGMPGFYVAFDAHDAHTAQLVCGEITSLFVSANLNAREQSAEGTTNFLKQQLDDAKATLDAQDSRLAAFQEKFLGRLPDQESSNTNTLQALTTQLNATTQTINQMQQNESFLQAMISQQTQDLQRAASPVSRIDERQKQLQSLIEQREQLEASYTPDYPDVKALTDKINELRATLNQAPAAPLHSSQPIEAAALSASPQLQQLRAQLRAVQQTIIPARQEQARIQQQIRTYEARIEQSPQVEEEYKKITRDHDTALQFYNNLLAKMNESSMATALEQRQQGQQFSVMDPPNLPDSPKFPNHKLFATGGSIAGLALGCVIAGLLEFRDTTIHSETDIWAFTKLPTLAVISDLSRASTQDGRHTSGRKSTQNRPRAAESIGS